MKKLLLVLVVILGNFLPAVTRASAKDLALQFINNSPQYLYFFNGAALLGSAAPGVSFLAHRDFSSYYLLRAEYLDGTIYQINPITPCLNNIGYNWWMSDEESVPDPAKGAGLWLENDSLECVYFHVDDIEVGSCVHNTCLILAVPPGKHDLKAVFSDGSYLETSVFLKNKTLNDPYAWGVWDE